MRWSSAIRVGLSGTSLALAMMGCSKGDDTAKREADSAAEQANDDAYDSEKRDAERAEKRETERAAEQARVRREEESRLADRNSSGEPTPWFLRPAGDTKQASVQQNDGQQPIASDPPEQPKPIVKKPIQRVQQNPNQPPPGGWRVRAACGRG